MRKTTISEELEIIKPIFIVGVPRSGTTLLYHLLAQHPDLGWFSKNLSKKFFTDGYLQFVYRRRRVFSLRGLEYPQNEFNKKYFSTIEWPSEAGFLWNRTFKGDWEVDISEKNFPVLIEAIRNTLSEQKKKRFLSKFPKNSIRISILNKFFPESKFIHIIRDGRVVVKSLVKRAKENPDGYFGIPLKSQGMKNCNDIEKHAIQWKQVVEDIKNSSKNLKKGQYMEIKYEDFIRSPRSFIEQITKFCELGEYDYYFKKRKYLFFKDDDEDFSRWEIMESVEIENRNKKYKENFLKKMLLRKLNREKKNYSNDLKIENYLTPTLKEFGYV